MYSFLLTLSFRSRCGRGTGGVKTRIEHPHVRSMADASGAADAELWVLGLAARVGLCKSHFNKWDCSRAQIVWRHFKCILEQSKLCGVLVMLQQRWFHM